MDEKDNYDNISKSVSQYSDAYDDYEQIDKEPKLSSSTRKDNSDIISIKSNDIFYKESNHNINKNNIVNKYSYPIPKDSMEDEDDKTKHSYFKTIKENEEELNDSSINNADTFKNNKQDDDVDSFNLTRLKDKARSSVNMSYTNSKNISKINNIKSDNDDLYSNKQDYTNNVVQSEQSSYYKKDTDNIETNNENSNIIIVDCLEPQDTSYEKAKSNINEKINNDFMDSKHTKDKRKMSFKSQNSHDINIKNNRHFRSSIFSDGVNFRRNSKSSEISKKEKKRKAFNAKNILKKAVILNSKNIKKSRFTIKESANESFLSNGLNNFDPDDPESPPINNIVFENIRIDELNTNYLKKSLRRINVDSKNNNPKHNYIKTLIELQNFYIDDSSVWVIKISHDGKYLAGGCKSGKIKIYEVIGYNYSKFKTHYNKKNIMEYLNFINETPYKTFEKHKSDVIDLSWSPFFPNLLLSASLDHFVYLWDISKEGNNCLLNEYSHGDIVTSVNFNPTLNNEFISGCLDTFVYIWKFKYLNDINESLENNLNLSSENNINKIDISDNTIITNDRTNKKKSSHKKKLNIFNDNKSNNNSFNDINKTNEYLNLSKKDKKESDYYFNLEHKVTALSFFPDGSKIGIGTEKGRIYVYNTSHFNYNNNFFVSQKKLGFFHDGKKVTNIQFIDKIHAIISTSDSFIRLVDMSAGKILYQYEGYMNKYSMIRGYTDLSDDVIIVGGEDGNCYIWNLFDKEGNKDVNKKYEFFKPFAKELIECTLIAHEKCYVNYMQKILKLTNKILILSIIVNGTSKGRLEILLNIDESIQN